MTAQPTEGIALHRIHASAEISREHLDTHDQMRRLSAAVSHRGGDGLELDDISSVTGWVSRSFDPVLLAAAGDAVGQRATVLRMVAEEIIDGHPDMTVSAVLLIDRIVLDQEWQGHGLSTGIIDKVLAVLQLDPASTLIVLRPEPLVADGSGPLEPGYERDAAMVKLRATLYAADYRPWKRGFVWWRPLESQPGGQA